MFEAPIPGQSLTEEPRKYPFERPPELSDPEEVIQLYLDRLSEEERIEGVLDALEVGLDIKTLTEGIIRKGVSEGVHSIDVGLIIGPVIHDYIKDTADKAGIEYDEGFEDEEENEKGRKAIDFARAKAKLEKKRASPKQEEEEVDLPEDTQEPPKRGLMARPAKPPVGDV